ncbi:MAG: Hydrogenase maturation protein, carbamoyl dehydratase HypE, partial [Acidobacteria bacterium]|nr:Hydrogenase maturation protein, carbamoyl dehydratase HypE [Acidobacteriota bacterium]
MPDFTASCPVPVVRHDRVTLAHGGGGRLMHALLDSVFLSTFENPLPDADHDAAVFSLAGRPGRLAFTTDSYVVRPLFFPGGDIGALAVNGTVNDLAMAGARPRFLSAGFIVEEGLEVATLERVARSMQAAASRAEVHIVTGDTKVVERGKADGLYLNTAGVGVVEHDLRIAPAAVRPGDVVIVSGDLGRHGMAVMAEREGLSFEAAIESDCAPLAAPVLALIEAGLTPHCLRDLTRGGLASALNEIASAAGVGIVVDEQAIRVRPEVRGACEMLGLDPLYVANEGRFAAFLPAEQGERALEVLS